MPQLDLAREQAELDALRAFWQPVLRVADYEVSAQIDPSIAPNLGLCLPDHVYKRAVIRIAPRATPGQDLEASLVHELVHLHFAAFETGGGTPIRNEEERSVESLTRALVDLKRTGAPLGAVRSLARGAFNARARLSSLAHGARGLEKHRTMDPKILAALAIEAGQLMGVEGVPDEVKAFLQKCLEAMAGGGESPESQGEPHAAGGPPAPGQDPNKPPAAGPPPGEEQKPPMRTAANPLEERMRAIELKIDADTKERKAADERARNSLLAASKARIPDGQAAFAASLPLTQLEQYVATLPGRPPLERNGAALRGPVGQGPGAGGEPATRARLREAMGIVTKDVELPYRDGSGRKTWPVNGPTALRRALSAEGGAK